MLFIETYSAEVRQIALGITNSVTAFPNISIANQLTQR